MFFRPGGSSKRINTQYDSVYVDFVNGATDWLPVYFGNWVAVHVARASIMFSSPASSVVSKNVVSPEAEVLLEMKSFGGQKDEEAWPLDYWQNVVVATGRRVEF